MTIESSWISPSQDKGQTRNQLFTIIIIDDDGSSRRFQISRVQGFKRQRQKKVCGEPWAALAAPVGKLLPMSLEAS